MFFPLILDHTHIAQIYTICSALVGGRIGGGKPQHVRLPSRVAQFTYNFITQKH